MKEINALATAVESYAAAARRCIELEAKITRLESSLAAAKTEARKEALDIDEICCEWGPPEYVMTDDGEAWYWRFAGHELPVANNLSELFRAAIDLERRALQTDLQSQEGK